MDIKVKVKGAKLVDISKLEGTQGKMKYLDDESYEKFKKIVIENGFVEPITVWEGKNKLYILNGHQRLTLLKRMIEEGFNCPKIPVSLVEAKSLKEAKSHVISLASQHGKFDNQGLFDFLNDIKLPFSEFKKSVSFADFDIGTFENQFFSENEPTKEVKNTSKEIDISGITKLKHQCPKCGFEFDNGK